MSADLITAIVDEGLGNSSYLVDLGDRRALVVDPERDPAPYLAAAADRGLRLAYVAETHLHADFVSGSRELAAQGAEALAAAAGRTAFPHRGLDDGTEVDLGGLTLRALATPGHTPEHLSYLLLVYVRQDAEYTAGHIPGALHVELGSVGAAGIAATRTLTLMCGHGERAMTAASILEAAGHRDLRVVVGGVADWATASGHPPKTGR